MTKWQVFRALQGHKIVAGGNAPGMRRVSAPTLKGSYYPARGPKTGVTPRRFDPAPAGSDLLGDAFPGGVAPGYCIDPLRGSRMDSAEDVPRAQKVGKRPCDTIGLICSTETSNASSFWGGVPRNRSPKRTGVCASRPGLTVSPCLQFYVGCGSM